MSTLKSVAFHTLGCKLNFAETSTLARQFEQNGFVKTAFEDPADVYVINTCSVTEDANRECRRIVRNALRNSPDAFVVVTGCYAQLKPEEIAGIKGVDLVLGASEKFNAIHFISEGNKKEKAEIHSCAIEEVHDFVPSFSSTDRTRSFLKVQDGCDYNCSYCTIPLARGASRSDSIESVVRNAENLGEQGVKEIILTGVNIGDFGKKGTRDEGQGVGEETFLELIQAMDELEGIERIRISSIEPNLLTNDIIEFVANSKRFVPHFHIPLQSGSDKILKAMRRRYDRELYAERVSKIKLVMPDCSIGADVIVGFPGETEEDFLDTYNFINKLDVSYLHVFTYSERENTTALRIKEVVPMAERNKRSKMLHILSDKKRRFFYEQNLRTTRKVLFEKESNDDMMHGFTENYIKVKTKYDAALLNEIKEVKLNSIDTDGEMLIEETTNHFQSAYLHIN